MAKFRALTHLESEAGERARASATAPRGPTCVRSNITQLVDRLEADGLVTPRLETIRPTAAACGPR